MKIIILTFLILGLIITLSLIKKKTKKQKQQKLNYSNKTTENFKEIELSHGTPSICINKEKGFSQWDNKQHIFKKIILRDQNENNVYTICKIKLSDQDLEKIKFINNIDYYDQELHIKGNSVNENTKLLYNILSIICEKDGNPKVLIKEINKRNKNLKKQLFKYKTDF